MCLPTDEKHCPVLEDHGGRRGRVCSWSIQKAIQCQPKHVVYAKRLSRHKMHQFILVLLGHGGVTRPLFPKPEPLHTNRYRLSPGRTS